MAETGNAEDDARLQPDGEADGGERKPRRGSLEGVFQELCDAAEGDELTVGDILDKLAHRSFGPLLLFPSLIAILPVIGALPGVSWAMSGMALVVSLHFLLNRRSLWVPAKVRKFKVPSSKFRKAMDWTMPWLRRIDHFLHRRFQTMLRSPWPLLIAVLCVLLSIAMFIASIVPGGIVIPGLCLALIAIGLTAHDGLVLAIGTALSLTGFWFLWLWIG